MIVKVHWQHLNGEVPEEYDVQLMNSHPFAGTILVHPHRTSLYQALVSVDFRGRGYSVDAEIWARELPGTEGATDATNDEWFGEPRRVIYKSPVPNWAQKKLKTVMK